MRHLPSLLLLPVLFAASAIAAEALSNKAMDKAYVPETTPCLPRKDKPLPKDCEAQQTPTGSLTDKALRNAEQQNTNQSLNNPLLNNPDALPPPSQLPPPPLTPVQQEFINQLHSHP